MQFEIYQWLVPLISVFFISRTMLQYWKKRRSIQGTLIWCFFWVILIILAIIPNAIAEKTASILGFRDNVNAVIFVALGLLFFFVFYLSSLIERLESQLTALVRKMAFEEQRQKELFESERKKLEEAREEIEKKSKELEKIIVAKEDRKTKKSSGYTKKYSKIKTKA